MIASDVQSIPDAVRSRRPVRSIVTSALIAAAAFDVVLFFYYLKATIIRLPYWDMYWYVLRYLQFRQDGEWWAYLWAPHVQHHPVWTRLLIALDVEAFSGVVYPLIAFAVICQLTTAWLLWQKTRGGASRDLSVAKGCLAIMLVLTSVSAVDCAIPITGVYPQAVMFAVLAFVLFDARDESVDRYTSTIHYRRIAAMVAAMAAAFGSAAALGVWPILSWLAWRARAGRTWILTPIVVGAAFIAVYLQDLPIVQSVAGSGSELRMGGADHLREMGKYLITYLGLPLTRAAAFATVGRVFGAALLLVSVALAVQVGFAKRRVSHIERLGVALILFSLTTAVMAAAGRVDIAEVSGVLVPVRYSVFLTPAHVGLLLVASPLIGELWESRRRRVLVQAAMFATAALLLAQQVAGGEAAAATARSMRATIQQFIRGERQPGMTRVIYSDLDQAQSALEQLQRAGVYVNLQ